MYRAARTGSTARVWGPGSIHGDSVTLALRQYLLSSERQDCRDHEHLDASAGVEGIEAFYEQCVANGAKVLKPLEATDWGTKNFYVEDPDGHIVSFGGTAAGYPGVATDAARTLIENEGTR